MVAKIPGREGWETTGPGFPGEGNPWPSLPKKLYHQAEANFSAIFRLGEGVAGRPYII